MLNISRLVSVQTEITQAGALGRNFNQALAIGDSNVISGLQRVRNYSSLADVAADFGTTAPEYLAASVYFDQSPTPTSFACGRWLRTATAAMLDGAILSAPEQAIALFQAITNGGFDILIDGGAQTLTALNFSNLSNLNAVAAAIQTAFSGAATCVWNGFQFVITSATTGAGVKASGTVHLTGQPTADTDTITIDGTAFAYVSALTTGNQILVGSSTQITAANTWAALAASVDTNVIKASYSLNSTTNTITATYKSVGTAGNAFTLAKSGSNISVSAGTLAGGLNASSVGYATSPSASYQDVSTLLGLTAALGLPLVPGYTAESALDAVVACDAASNDWYGMGFASSVMPSDSDYLSIAAFIEADEVTRMFGVTTEETGVLTTQVSNDIASELKALGFNQSFVMYSSTNPYAAFAIFGNLLTINLNGSNTWKTMMYQQAVGIAAEDLTDSEANSLQTKNCNVFTSYDNNTSIVQYGICSGGNWIDETFGANAFSNGIQTADYNVMYASDVAVPQTDQGDQQFNGAMSQVCQQYVTNGFLAPGQWNASGFGSLLEGQFLTQGYYIYMQPLSAQSEAQRAARQFPPFQIAAKLAGANQGGSVLIIINQ